MVGFVIWIVGLVLTYQGRFGNMAHSCTGREETDSHRIGGFHQLGRIAVLLFLW